MLLACKHFLVVAAFCFLLHWLPLAVGVRFLYYHPVMPPKRRCSSRPSTLASSAAVSSSAVARSVTGVLGTPAQSTSLVGSQTGRSSLDHLLQLVRDQVRAEMASVAATSIAGMGFSSILSSPSVSALGSVVAASTSSPVPTALG